MKVLAFDTALGGCSVGVVDTETGLAEQEIRPMGRGQSESLVPIVQDIIARSGFSFSDLDLIATTVGPGAFTGLRIGLSAARSFGLALDIPVDGLLTTEVIAAQFFNQNKGLNSDLLVLIETKREDFYCQVFDRNNKALEAAVALSDEAILAQYQKRKMNICGDGLGRFSQMIGDNWPENWTAHQGFDLTHPLIMAQMAVERHKAGQARDPDPVYLRAADVSISTRPLRKIADA